jgi:hypothetical protein
MSLSDADALDAITANAEGKPNLVIVDDDAWEDDERRWSGLLAKLRSYIGYLHSPDFEARFPGVAPREVTVEVVCEQPPSGRMAGLTSFAPRGDESNRIRVRYTRKA